ncbi:MAG: hypothetical protein BBJ57_02160 [Desulfobacterales bacterium PC51MH44]|nr:MAG: hypothetical protein BBJ57_02160 [Desulfobacterales bacterium PC51MH44]
MAWLSGALSVAGTLISAYSQYKEGQDAKDVYEYNQELARYQAQYIEDASKIELAALERDVGEYISRSRAITGKSGTVVDKGSSADVIAETLQQKDIDAGIIRWRTSRLSEMARKGANLLGTQADQFATAGKISAGTTLLAGLSSWDWKTSQLSAPYSKKPPVPAFSGYTPSR